MENKDFTEATDMEKTIPWKKLIIYTDMEDRDFDSDYYMIKRKMIIAFWCFCREIGERFKIDEQYTNSFHMMRIDYIEYKGEYYITKDNFPSKFTLHDLTEGEFVLLLMTNSFYHYVHPEWPAIPEVFVEGDAPLKEWEDNWKKKYADYHLIKHLKKFSGWEYTL